jgi:putative DNA primase/helicase
MAGERPHALALCADNVPADLRGCPQWVTWRYELRHGKWTKVLKNPSTGRNAKSDDATTWRAFEEAIASCSRQRMDGVGFVFTAVDAFAGLDLDKCRNLETGMIEAWALTIIKEHDSYAEISPSGTGVKIFVRAKIPQGGNRKGQIELYDRGRYFTVTGHHVPGTPRTVEDRQAEVNTLHTRTFQPVDHAPHHGGKGLPSISYQLLSGLGDDALISRALAAKNGIHFAQLWSGDASSYGSHSEADAALCALLAFWTGPDGERIDRLFRRSGLYREKWDERHYGDGRTYGQVTINLAMSRQAFYGGGPGAATKAFNAQPHARQTQPLPIPLGPQVTRELPRAGRPEGVGVGGGA